MAGLLRAVGGERLGTEGGTLDLVCPEGFEGCKVAFDPECLLCVFTTTFPCFDEDGGLEIVGETTLPTTELLL